METLSCQSSGFTTIPEVIEINAASATLLRIDETLLMYNFIKPKEHTLESVRQLHCFQTDVSHLLTSFGQLK